MIGESDEMCIKHPVALKIAFGGNLKGAYGGNGKAPMTRMSIVDILIDTLNKGKAYMHKKEVEKSPDLQYNIGMENVSKVLKKEMPLKVHCEQFDVDFTIEHGWGASNFIDEIAASGIKGEYYVHLLLMEHCSCRMALYFKLVNLLDLVWMLIWLYLMQYQGLIQNIQ